MNLKILQKFSEEEAPLMNLELKEERGRRFNNLGIFFYGFYFIIF